MIYVCGALPRRRYAIFGLAAGAGGVTVSAAMKTLPAKAKISGLTLIEVLVVIFVIVVLAAMLLPALSDRNHKGDSTVSMLDES